MPHLTLAALALAALACTIGLVLTAQGERPALRPVGAGLLVLAALLAAFGLRGA